MHLLYNKKKGESEEIEKKNIIKDKRFMTDF
jgi:hypothetical protein